MCLFTLLLGALLARPALAQQTNPRTNGPTEVARTTDDLRERILMDRIDELEKRLADLEERTSEPVATAAAAPAAVPASAPAASPAATPAPQGSTPAPWSIGPVDISGVIDGYYTFNTNHPSTMANGRSSNGVNTFNFNTAANQFDLNLAKITLSHDAAPVGFTFDFGFGKTMSIINSFDNDFDSDFTRFNKYVEQAYVSWKPGQARGLQLDFGKFVTSAGAEVIETHKNWNYSRSLLFALALPYYHFGLRSAIPVGSHFTVGAQLVNGWNNLADNNSGKTVGITSAVTYSKFQWFTNYYGGPENTGTNTGWRHLIDTTVLVTPTSTLSAYINYDYGQNRNAVGTVATSLSRWQGFAGAIHWQPTAKWSFTPRGEWFKDYQGFSTGVSQVLNEVTFTGEYKLMNGLLWRAEYRRDWSDVPFYTRGTLPCRSPFGPTSCPANFGLGNSKHQNTITVGIVGFFGGPKN